MRHPYHLIAVTVAACLLSGCLDDLTNGGSLDRPRVLSVRVDIPSDPELAQPAPGESFALRWFTAPADSAWTYALSACVGAPSNQGLPACAGEPFAIGFEPTPSNEAVWQLDVPADAAGELLVAGVLCEGGVPQIDEEGGLPTCSGEMSTRELVSFSVDIALGEARNRHPAWPANDAISLEEGEVWPPPPDDLADGACADREDIPRLVPPDEEEPVARFGFATRTEDRENFEALLLGDPPTMVPRQEELLISHISSLGTFARPQTEVFDDESAVGEAPWRYPEEIPAEGVIVRFWWVLRDGRGGSDWTERAACVLPRSP